MTVPSIGREAGLAAEENEPILAPGLICDDDKDEEEGEEEEEAESDTGGVRHLTGRSWVGSIDC